LLFLNPVRYISPVTYTRAHMTHFLSREEWRQILHAGSTESFLQILQKTAYGQDRDLATIDPSNLIDIEREIYAYWAEAAMAPMVFLRGAPRDLLKWQWRLFEVDNLKILLRGLDQSLPVERIKRSLVPLPSQSKIDWMELAEKRSVSDLVYGLMDTPYGPMLRIALDRYQKERSLFGLEIALDLGYNRGLLKSIEDQQRNDRQVAERFLGNVIDSRLIIWSYRFRIYVGMEPEQILNYTLERGIRVRFKDIKAIALGAEIETILRDIYGEAFVDQVQGIPLESAVQELEIIFLRHRLAEARKERLKPPFSLGLLLAYETELESEALDLITILAGIQVGLSGDEIRSHLILGEGAHV